MSTELMLLDKSSLSAYLELRKEVQENFVGPVARIMQIELDLLKSGFSEPALMMENFNEILDLYPEAMLYSEEEQKIIRRVLHSAVVQFVAFAQMNLIVERRKVRDSLKSFILSTFDGAVPIIKEAILAYSAGAASGKCSKMLSALGKLSKNEEFKLNCESFVDTFFRNTLDFASCFSSVVNLCLNTVLLRIIPISMDSKTISMADMIFFLFNMISPLFPF